MKADLAGTNTKHMLLCVETEKRGAWSLSVLSRALWPLSPLLYRVVAVKALAFSPFRSVCR